MRAANGDTIRIGSKVKLTNADPGYSINGSNPLVGTKWECVGVYVGEGTVEWENGQQNSYKNGELSLENDKCVDIWLGSW